MAATSEIIDMPSSQEQENHLGLPSPPPSSPSLGPKRTRPRKPPPITPKRFTKFFSPRNLGSSMSKTGRILRDITSNGSNRLVSDDFADPRPMKKRRTAPPIFEDPPSPTSEPQSPLHFASSPPLLSSPCYDTSARHVQHFPHPVQRARITYDATSWLSNTASFQTSPNDIHEFGRDGLPFCVRACNTNTLVAIGTEEGEVRIIESARDCKTSFSEPYVSFKPHENAIMDLAFSSDDHYLATASGDQTGRIVDMYTQQTLFILNRHACSLKQISFMPDNDRIVATCSRDGVVGLWDLRCHASMGPSYHSSTGNTSDGTTHVKMYNSIVDTHAQLPLTSSASMSTTRQYNARPSTSPTPATTSLTFLPPALGSHLFLTSCADSAQLRLWDIRGRYSSRRGPAIPLSVTAPIPSHSSHRNFGVNAMSLSTDGARLYTVCRDSTVYAYSTNHLILGQASELTSDAHLSRWHKSSTANTGAGPLYGLRNPSLRTGSFYVRSAVRRATDFNTEILAVGSSEACPVLFPTDESLFHSLSSSVRYGGRYGSVSTSHRRSPAHSLPHRTPDFTSGELPVYTLGTPLVRGHTAEVTGVSFTSDGELVSISDDYRVRVWREDAATARGLRIGGEGEGKRWGCGWAELPLGDEWDDDDG